ncbi:TM9S1 protein, partial [Atractosteus spatula]|nr:TM9S1 protein [Atractosteus spatula]
MIRLGLRLAGGGLWACLLSCWLLPPGGGAATYKQGDPVTLYVNKVGPYHNPQETYHYYTLPVCRPKEVRHKALSLGEVLDGDRMAESLYEIRFRENAERMHPVLRCNCISLEFPLVSSLFQVEQLKEAVEELYYFEFVLDEIPIWGFVGYMEESGFLPHSHKVGLWTHLDFNIEYNGDAVIFANVSVKDVKPVPLDGTAAGGLAVTHTYSVRWFESPLPHGRRSERLRDYSFFPKTLEIHWLSIINSLVLVVLLLGFVIIILMRVLKNDFARILLCDLAPPRAAQAQRWNCTSTSSDGDRLQYADHLPSLFSVGIIVMALLGMFNVHRHGAINSAAIALYALTSCVSGFVSSHFYRQIEGQRWVWNIILTSSLFSAPLFLTWSVVNTVHWLSGSTQALPVSTVLLLLCVWALVGFPLAVIGGILGKNRAGPFQAPCRTRNIPRQVPPQPWYKHTAVHMAIGGFLPFSAISVELYYIFATVWGREHYTLYGILLVVFAILLSVGACISVALTYFLLSGEDHRWWWRSVLSTGSTGIFIFLYSLFYYRNRSSMSGLVQSVEFFGYSFLTALVFALMLGTVSFWSSLAFIRYIYRNLKMD